jgi:hypothetical protein
MIIVGIVLCTLVWGGGIYGAWQLLQFANPHH